MSNERRHQDGLGDPLVSSAYRDLSDERAPEHLDHVVLNAARKAAKPGYAATISWLRPAAWVTTIGLCLAIVIEVSDMTSTEDAAFDAPLQQEQVLGESEESDVAAPAVTAPTAEAKASDSAQVDSARPERSEALLQKTRRDQPASDSGRFDESQAEEMPATAVEPVNAKRQTLAPVEVDSFNQDDRQLLRDAEERARMQTDGDQEPVDSPLLIAPAGGLASDTPLERHCEESATVDPNSWLACILELEQQGLLEAAMVERDLLRESFPDQPALISR